MPKFVREKDRDRFRIIPAGTKFIVQEKTSFLGLWDIWNTIQWHSYGVEDIFYFLSVEEAKEFIDLKIKNEEIAEHNENGGVIYYP